MAFAGPLHEVLHVQDVDPSVGLSSAEAASRLARHGRNELEEPPPTPLWKLVLEQFDDLLVKMLLAAAAISFCLALSEPAGEARNHAMVEPLVILAILVLNALVGVWQESNAEKAIEALKAYEPNDAEVMRDGAAFRTMSAAELVPGDVVRVTVGCRVPADLRLIRLEATTLRADQVRTTLARRGALPARSPPPLPTPTPSPAAGHPNGRVGARDEGARRRPRGDG